MKKTIVNALTIAGVDPSGGAGVFADIKTMSALGAYATGVVTAVTAQNTRTVSGVFPVPTDFVIRQIDTLFADVRIDAVKIGMLFDSHLIKAVAERLEYWRPRFIVLDPVMIAKTGDALLEDSAVEALRDLLLPMSTVITPNLPEAARLLESVDIDDHEKMEAAASDLWKLKGRKGWVFLKGGHLEGESSEDVLYDGRRMIRLKAERINTPNTHGTGCTLSSALTALLPVSSDIPQAARDAKHYLTRAIAHADELDVGSGHGPVHHFQGIWR